MFTGAADAAPGMSRRAWTGEHPAPDEGAAGHAATADLRLVPPATGVWAGAASASGAALPTAVLAGAAGVVGSVVLTSAVALARSGGSARLAGHRAGARLTAAVVVAFFAAGVVVAGLAARSRATSVVAGLAVDRRSVDAELVVTDDPRRARSSAAAGSGSGSPSSAPMYVVPARTEQVVPDGGRAVREQQPVLVLATADGWQALAPSQRLWVRGRLAESRTGDVAAVLFVREPPREVREPSTVQRAAAHVRGGLRQAADVLPEETAGLLPALVVGDTSRLADDVRADFQAAGMVHLTAVSGANVAIVVGTAMALARRTRLGPRSRAVWAGAALVGFVVLARPSASVLRAGTMGMIGVVAAGCGRPRQALPALCATVVVLVLADPDLARSVGFALSVLATAGILVLAPRWGAAWSVRWPRLPPLLVEVAAVAVAAQLACTPVLAWIGGEICLVAVPANMAAVAAVPPATVLGVLAAATAVVSDPLAEVFAWLGGLPCRWLVEVAAVAAKVPGGSVGWPAGVVGALTSLAVVAVVAVVLPRRRARRVLAAACAGALLGELVLAPAIVPGWPPPGWVLVACDVGQGDAMVLAAGAGSAVLVDAGPDSAALERCLVDLGVRALPVVVVSHLHADHVVGLAAVLGPEAFGSVQVGTVLVGPSREPADQWHRLEAAAAAAGVPIRQTGVGERGEAGAVRWEVLGPLWATAATEPNDASLVLRAEVGGLSMLLTGDAEPPAQRQLAGSPGLGVDVLKVPHHGAADQDPTLLAATGAAVALVCVGAGNTYGHPAPETLALLDALGMAVARTDVHADVAVVRAADGRAELVSRRRGPP